MNYLHNLTKNLSSSRSEKDMSVDPEEAHVKIEAPSLADEAAGILPTSSTQSTWQKKIFTRGEVDHIDRYVTVKEYQGKVRVDIRGWFTHNGQLQPSKRGISLTVSEFEYLVHLIPQIQAQVKEQEQLR
ncbi:hypothetical protein F4819DRAFT_418240 [Hypoxylon fuscum]|nr:hypothetical protein F4819DRAFT_418240 [Hypoxylon fuscum]